MEVPTDAIGNPVTALGRVSPTANGRDKSATIEVAMRTLDSLVDDNVVRPIAPVFMKIDVEGSEQSVLSGATRLLSDFRPVIYFECQRGHVERTGGKPEEIWQTLLGLGYVILAPCDGLYHPCSTVIDGLPNYLAIPVPLQDLRTDRPSAEALIALLNRDAPSQRSTLANVSASQTGAQPASDHGGPENEVLELNHWQSRQP